MKLWVRFFNFALGPHVLNIEKKDDKELGELGGNGAPRGGACL